MINPLGYLAKVTEDQLKEILAIDGTTLTFQSKWTNVVGIKSTRDIMNEIREIVGKDNVSYERYGHLAVPKGTFRKDDL